MKESSGLKMKRQGEGYVVAGMGTCKDDETVIPSKYRGLPVTGVAAGAFSFCDEIYSVTIPEGVTYIGDGAFRGCSSLEKVAIPAGLKFVGADVFPRGCVFRNLELGEDVLAHYEKRADEGDAEALYILGLKKLFSGVPKERERAYGYFAKAAEKGNARAEYEAGKCLDSGVGVEENPEKAFETFLKAASAGVLPAALETARCFLYGEGTKENLPEAARWYGVAADAGNDFARCRLGFLYENGDGVPKDMKKAASLYKAAAKDHYTEGELRFGEFRPRGGKRRKEGVRFVFFRRGKGKRGGLLLPR